MNLLKEILPEENELPVDYAERLASYYSSLVSQTHKKSKGQFFTPGKIARFMGDVQCVGTKNIRILDPGCGTAILSCGLIENLVSQKNGIDS